MNTMKFRGIKLDFEYESSPHEAQTLTDPEVDSEFNVLEVWAGDVEITELLDFDNELFCIEINEAAMESLRDEAEEWHGS